MAELLGSGEHYRSFARAPERIDAALERKAARQTRLSALAQGAHFVAMARDLRIARLDRGGERKVRERVLVRAVHLGVRIEAVQLRQRVMQLAGSAFEQAAAAGGEHRIAAEQAW